MNKFGKGRAIYVAVPAQASVLGSLVRRLYSELAIGKGPATPAAVYARVVEGRTLYVNTTGEGKSLPIRQSKLGVISGRRYNGLIRLKPYDADLVE